MTETDAFSRAIRRKSWREIFSRTCRPLRSSLLNLQKEGRRGWIGIGRKELRKESSAIFLFLRPRFCQNNCFSPSPPPLSLSLSLPLPLQCSTSSIFFGTRSISFFLCVRLTDKVPPALILKKSLSLSLSLLVLYILGGALTRALPSVEGAHSLARPPCLLRSGAVVLLLFHLPLSPSPLSRSLFYLP